MKPERSVPLPTLIWNCVMHFLSLILIWKIIDWMQCGCVIIYLLIDLFVFSLKRSQGNWVTNAKNSHQTTRNACLVVNFCSSINKSLVFQFDFMCAAVLHNQPIWELALVQSTSRCVLEARVFSDFVGSDLWVEMRMWCSDAGMHRPRNSFSKIANMETYICRTSVWQRTS